MSMDRKNDLRKNKKPGDGVPAFSYKYVYRKNGEIKKKE